MHSCKAHRSDPVALQCQVGDTWSWFGPSSFVTPGGQEPCGPREELTAHRPPSAVTGCSTLTRRGRLSAGVPMGGLAAVPQGTSTDVTSLPSLFLLHAVPKTGKKEKKKALLCSTCH